MVSFHQHYNQCWAPVSCIDCMTTFPNGTFQSHTSCMTESQKYYGQYHRPEKENKKSNKGEKRRSMNGHSQAMVPKGAYVEDVVEGDDMNAVAVIDVPPRAPTPPQSAAELEGVNVFDFLVQDATPKLGAVDESRMLEHATPADDGSSYLSRGYSYGNGPLQPSFERYDSYPNLTEAQNSFVTPAPKEHKKEKKEKRGTEKSDKKRKRNVEDLDLSSVKRPVSRDQPILDAPSTGGRVLHSGLTGGLGRLVTDNEFYKDRIDAGPTPISPSKRSKRDNDLLSEPREKDAKKERRKSSYVSYSTSTTTKDRDRDRRARSRSPERERERRHHHRRSHREDSLSSEDRSRKSRQPKGVEYDRPMSVQPTSHNQMVAYHQSRAELFMSLVTKGPESQHGLSINKVLKRYHRERDVRGEREKEDEDKELWKSLRLRRNERGEIVVVL
ncbi:hypothetical protein AC579_4910 [Pseudocercospora musae]|uniref:Zinc finger C2H2 LYAR-type domain-containing protein n=1 Tax=Pseudocercospora musae TaxID=113226 RepID=A0A139IE73_9PEZI|nr:hypothetical protein AC579_4910 [Pseudocercospora musae]